MLQRHRIHPRQRLHIQYITEAEMDEELKTQIRNKLIVALDVNTLEKAIELVNLLSPHVGTFKIGLELLTSINTQELISFIHSKGNHVFYDGKFNDIPNTMAGAAKAVNGLKVKMFTVHASSGDGLRAAVANKGNSLVLAVTILSSFKEVDCLEIFGKQLDEMVLKFTENAFDAKADGIVCSPLELDLVKTHPVLKNLITVVPGIRPSWAMTNDQARIMTPGEAIKKGADYLVVGRPITNPPESVTSPVEAVNLIISEIIETLKK